MKAVLKSISYAGLVLTLIPSLLVFTGTISLDASKSLMLLGTVCWFITAPSWMNK